MDSLFIVDFIRSVGFPIFVAVYLLVYQSKIIKDNTRAIRDLHVWLNKNKGGK